MSKAIIKSLIYSRPEVKDLAEQLLAHPDAYEPPTNHYFLDGMYCREMFAHAGSILVGVTHKTACFNFLTEGTIVVSNGEKEVVLKAPQTFIGSAETQKTAFALTDVVWVNVFRTDTTTVAEAEKELFVENIYKEK